MKRYIQNHGLNGLHGFRLTVVLLLMGLMTAGNAMADNGVKVHGNVYGGGNAADVGTNATVNISAGQIGVGQIDSDHGNVFGGGRGQITTVVGNVEVNIGKVVNGESITYSANGNVKGSVYGGSALGAVNATKANDWDETHLDRISQTAGKTTKVYVYAGTINEDVYGGGRGQIEGGTIAARTFGETTVTVGDEAATASPVIDGSVFGGSNLNGVSESGVYVNVIRGTVGKETTSGETTTVTGGNVHGGGFGEPTLVRGSVEVNIGLRTGTSPNYSYSGYAHILGDVYGGSAKGNVNAEWVTVESNSSLQHVTNTTTGVNLYGGTIDGDLYGGGLGDDTPNSEIAANVYGPVTVMMEGGSVHDIFGCNNLYGTPKSTVTVTVNNTDAHQYANAESSTPEKYAVNAVYGGGNLAHFDPETTGSYPTVTVNGCGSSIKTVYGGGNAAAVPYTNVTIYGGIIEDVFAGGNGESGTPANIGWKSKAVSPSDEDVYGLGKANATIAGGTIKRVFGGSNSNGLVRVSGDLAISKSTAPGAANGCDMKIGEVYGGGNRADGAATAFTIGCTGTVVVGDNGHAAHPEWIGSSLEGIGALYGGANAANVTGDISLTISSGIIANVYGGNNASGTISGSITVNVEKNALASCGWFVGNVYGGGNLAVYTGTPMVNIKNGTVSGNVYGGGNGDPTDDTQAKGSTGAPTVTIGDIEHTDTESDTYTAIVLGDVYGGGNAAKVTGSTAPTVLVQKCNTEVGYVYGGGNAADVPATNVTITGGTITGEVYGGGHGDKASLNQDENDHSHSDKTANVTGNVLVTVNGGTIAKVFAGSNLNGSIGGTTLAMNINKAADACDMKIGEVYGGGNQAAGNAGTITIGCTGTWTTTGDKNHTNANTTDNRIGYELEGIGTVYGGANQADIGTAESPSDITLNIHSGMVANVFGGNKTSGTIHGDIEVNIEKNSETCGWYVGNVYGGGNLAAFSQKTDGHPAVNIKNGTVSGNVYGGGKGGTAVVTGNPVVTIGDVTVADNCAVVSGSVYGGGDAAAVTGNTTVIYNDDNASSTVANLFGGGNAAGVSGTSTVTLTSGKVTAGIYGGCNTSGTIGGTVSVSIAGGTIGSPFATTAPTAPAPIPDVLFGGGLGKDTQVLGKVTVALPASSTATIYGNVYGGSKAGQVSDVDVNLLGSTIFGNVFGGGYQTDAELSSAAEDVTVLLNGTKFDRTYNGTAQIFGANNLQGTPTGHVLVHVKQTAAVEGQTSQTYYLASVYGGGNEADYIPTDETQSTEVLIEGCSETRIQDVYGGGNAAAVPASDVWVFGCSIIENVYGGGNGVLGAEYAAHVGKHRFADLSTTDYESGSGMTNVNLVGGVITNVYGGSNSNGDIRGGSNIEMPQKSAYRDQTILSDETACTLETTNVYGGGKNAPMSAGTKIVLGCMPDSWIGEIYAGAQAADVGGDAELTIVSGKFERVFGGNKDSGRLMGSIKVNIEETTGDDCGVPIVIGELYAGGNLAGYSIYGYKNTGTEASPVWEPRTEDEYNTWFDTLTDDEKAAPGNQPYNNPQLNVRAFTSIGAIYGGGYNALLVGDPSIDINVVKGSHSDDTRLHNGTDDTYPADNTGGTASLPYPAHKKGEIGAIGNVYGGGYSGTVIGDPSINIGTETSVDFITEPTHLGNRGEAYTYNETTKISTVPVQGANITGSVYGGGNAADIIGNATITVGTVDLTGTGKNGTKIGGDVFGGGFGPTTTVTGNVEVNIGSMTAGETPTYSGYATISGDVYGGSAKGKVNATKSGTDPDFTYTASSGTTGVNFYGGTITGDLYGGGYGLDNADADVYGPITVNVYNGSVNNVFGGNNLSGAPVKDVTVNISGGTIAHDVYGGGALANSNTGNTTNTSDYTTSVNLTGGTVNGDVYGGGLGRLANGDDPTAPGYLPAIPAEVKGDVTVTLNGTKLVTGYTTDETPVVNAGRVFGANNVNGTPKGHVKVLVQKTAAVSGSQPIDVAAVFGGGNLATYQPTSNTEYIEVEINETSEEGSRLIVGNVFGGGNEAGITAGTRVKIVAGDVKTGVYGGCNTSGTVTKDVEVDVTGGNIGTDDTHTADVFGGGLGQATLVNGNVIVNIGSRTGSVPSYTYAGSATIYGDVYGGSAKGNVNAEEYEDNSVTKLRRHSSTTTQVNLYGGTLYGDLYGGGLGDNSHAANVYGPVTVTVEGGTANNVFGCNNVNGAPQNAVAVTIDDTKEVIMGYAINNVYGGGNQAVYSYADENHPLTVTIAGGTINNVYGGGLSADVAGSITVNMTGGKVINDLYGGGALANTNTANWNSSSPTATYYTVSGLKPGESSVSDYYTLPITYYSASGTAQSGTTYYELTYSQVPSGDIIVGTTNVSSYYTRTGTEGNYVYHEIPADTKAAEGQTYYQIIYIQVQDITVGDDVTSYYTREVGEYTAASGTAVANTMYYRKVLGDWASGMNGNDNTTKYKTIVNLTGGIIGHLSDNSANDYLGGNVYGGGLGRLATNTEVAVEAMVYGDIEVTVDGTAFIQRLKSPGNNQNDVPFSGRVFGCNNLNGTPKGNVTVTISKTIPVVNGVVGTNHDENRFEIHSVYGGGNLASYMPADGKKTKVIIDGCDDTFIEKVFGGGNSASVPATDVVILGSGYIGYAFGGGNGADMIYKNGTWEPNDGAPIFGNASIIAVGGKIGQVFSGSDTKGTVYGSATVKLSSEGNVGYTSDCALKITNTYGAGRGADIEGDVNLIVSTCTANDAIERVFGGSYDANIRGDVNLTITSGIFTSVFGGNDHGGYIGGDINVNIEETDNCKPIVIQYLYGGGREAAYPGNGAKDKDGASVSSGNITVNVKSATRIDNVYGGSYRAQINGDTEVNINMIKGSWINKTISFPESYRGDQIPNLLNPTVEYIQVSVTYPDPEVEGSSGSPVTGYYIITGKDENNNDIYTKITDQDAKAESGTTYYKLTMSGTVKDDIGTIGNVFGGSFESLVNGSSSVNIGTEATIEIMKRATAGTTDPDTGDPIPVGTILATDKKSIYDNNGKIRDGITIDTNTESVLGANITGSVYGGGDQGDVGIQYINDNTIAIVGGTFVNIGAVKETEIMDGENHTGEYNYSSVSLGASGVTIVGNVYGGGRGLANTFKCDKGMVGHTNVGIGNGTITGSVFGGGEIGRTEGNTSVKIGTETGTSEPVIGGSVFGAGKGVNTHGYSALTRGNSTVTVQSNAKVGHSVYGGGEVASVGRYNVNAAGMPESLANQGSGYCTVTVQGNAEIGPNNMTMPTFDGNVFGGGKGVLPYEDVVGDPYRIKPNNTEQWFTEGRYVKESTQPANYEDAYLNYIETLALATQTYVTIDENAFIKGSVYGGSENGIIQHDTRVTISGGQIGNGWDPTLNSNAGGSINRPYNSTEWAYDVTSNDAQFLYECNSWPYGKASNDEDKYKPYDKYADASGYTSYASTTGDDGHTFYGNVFGGGSGYFPYAPGKWHWAAGAVYGNTYVTVTGGHILTSLYGGNELTNVGKGASDTEHGICSINFGGTATLGVPRTLDQIKDHPVTCYLFGGGKGDQRVLFNKQTNVNNVTINITGGTIYGSAFGGGEDGHVMRNVTMTIGNNDGTGPKIGTWGTSYVDGNVFGGGRGFAGDAYTAGNVGGSIDLKIKGGTMLGSIYGGGRLGSVGYGLYASNENGYGKMRDDDVYDDGTTANGLKRGYVTIDISGGTIGNDYEYPYYSFDVDTNNKTVAQIDAAKATAVAALNTGLTAAHIPNTEFEVADSVMSGTTRTYTYRLKHTKGGNVYAGGMGRLYQMDGSSPISAVDWWKLGNVKSTKLTISGGTIKSNVYGGSELGWVSGTHSAKDADNNDISVSTEIIIEDGTIGTEVKDNSSNVKYTFGSVYGGGFGSSVEKFAAEDDETTINDNPKFKAGRVVNHTKVSIQGGTVLASVYGGGEMANVGQFFNFGEETVAANTYVTVSGGTIGKDRNGSVYYGGPTIGNVYGGGSGNRDIVRSGLVSGNTYVNISGTPTIYHNIYGGGAYGTVGDFEYEEAVDPNYQNAIKVKGVNKLHTTGTGVANVTITGGTIGTDGHNNGMVFGSSRGDVIGGYIRDNYAAWVYDTHVTIGETGGDTSTPLISGSVYGSGENGHTFRNTYVTVHSGKIGLTTVQNTDPEDETKQGANYPQRGNVYGAGCGTDTYTGTDGKEHFEEMAGIVQGNATVVVDGGLVVHNVYGGGSMGSVGTIDDTKTVWHKSGNSTATNPTLGDHDTFYDFGLSWPVKFEYKSNAAIEGNDQVTGVTGVASVTITGSATIGVEDSKGGHVFGATRGDVEVGQADITDQRYEEAKFANVRKSEVIIGTKDGTATTPTIWGSVYGGGEDGHVYEDASVTIYHGTIAHSVFGGGKGEGQYTTTLYAIDPDHPNDNTKHIELDDQNVYSWTAGRVYGNTTVTMNGGSVGYFIYGGGNLGSVGKGNYAGGADDYSTVGYGELPSKDGSLWTATTGFNPDAPITSENQPSTMADYFLSSGKATVNIFGGSVGTASGADNAGIPYGSVFGGSRGKAAASCKRSPRYRYVPDFFLGYVNKAIINIGGTAVDALSSGSPTIHGSVYGGGQDGHVRNSTEVHIYKGSVVGKDDDEFGRSGHVFGAGSGIGTYDDGGVAKVNNSSGSVTCTSLVEVNGSDAYIVGNIYGGGALASVGPPKTGGVNQTYDEKNTPSGDWKSYSYSQVSIKAGTIGGNVFAASRGAGDSYLATNPHFDTDNGKYDATKYATDIWSNVHVSGGKIGYDSNGDVVADGGSVYGGGEAGQVKCGVTVNITGGEIAKDVYGGGALANTNTSNLKQDRLDNNKWKWTDAAKTAKYTTTVNLLGGTIHGDAYGGGLGRKEFGTEGQEGYVSPVEALAYGNVTVELNNGVNINQRGCVVSRIFGCNNLNGSPQGHVKVHVHATQPAGEGKTIKAADKFAKFKKRSEYTTTNYSELTTLATTVGINTEEAPFSTYLSTLSSGTDNEKKTALENMIEAIAKKKYDVLAVYGGGNLAAYTPMGPDALPGTDTDINNITTDYLNTEENTEVIIDGCELTSIKQVYGGGNAASTPANYVVVNGSYEIDEVFGGGNGADNYKLKEGSPTADVWYQNPGANVGYRNYTHYVKPGSTDPVYNSTTHGTGAEATPYLAITDAGADAEGDEGKAYRQAHYLYGTGVATTDIKGGKMHAVYGGSNKKGNISNTALSMYQGASDCVLDVDEAYGAGKNAPIDGKVDQRLKCAHGIKEMFGGAMNADVDNDINLTITNGSSLERVFGGNNTSGAINGTITVTIEEGGCEPIRIGELYAGGYLAPYSIYGYETNSDGSYKTENVSYIDKDGTTKSLAQRIPLTSGTARRDPIINVVSATYIGEIFGGGYQAKLVGNPRVNVNMTNGFVEVTKTEKTNSDPDTEDAFTEGEGENAKTYLYKDDAGNIYAPANVNNNLEVTLPIGTIGNIYGGGNLADVIGDTFVEIGTGEWTNKEGKREMDGTIQLNSQDFTSTFTYDETSKKWTYEKATTLSDSSINPVEGSTIEGTVTVNEETINATFTYISGKWTYGNENTVVAFGDITPMDRSTIQGTTSTITTATTFTYDATKVQWSYTAPEPINGTPTPTRNAATITDNVYGGGKGKADNYECDKAMIGEVNSDKGSTSVIIANGTVGTIEDGKLKDGTGNVYGGGKIGRVEANTEVTIGAEGVVTGNVFAPVIEGNVFGAGQGVATHGYSGLTRGHSTVTIQGKAKVRRSVYGGGEMATVGRFWVRDINDTNFADRENEKYDHVPTGMPYALMKGGECSVTVKDDAEIGTDNMKMLHLDNTGNVVNGEDGTPLPPDDWGHVFGAGKGVLPYENVGTDGPKRMIPDGSWESYVGKDTEYLKYIETLALANNTKVTIEGNAFIKGSVYGGSENGRVLNDTHVTIQDNCQIGCGVDKTEPYSEALWTQAKNAVTAEEIATIAELMPECASWPYGKNIGTEQNPQMIYAPYDRLALSTPGHEEEYDAKDEDDHPISTEGGRRIASDGHTFYGNVFGGGSGLYPYKPGKWHRQAGSVGGNTVVNITGGHILTSVYGGNEQTDVGTYTKDAYFNDPIIPKSGGKSTVNMVGGTLGVPRTLNQIKNHPVTCYLFGAGKGDQRIFFNTWTNVTETEVNVTGTARIFGSVFGGGEDGHIINDAKTTIGGSVSIDLNGDGDKTDEGETFTAQNDLKIGTWGTSYVDGNVFGAGRGFSGEALTAGSVGGNVLVNIAGGTMLGSVYGGGRLASVGTFFTSTTNPYYGQLQEDVEDDLATTDVDETNTHGHITINISGGTIGNDLENITVEHTKGGNVFGGSMGRLKMLDEKTINPLWPKMGTVKTTKINIYGDALIKGNVYGGGEYGMTRGDTHVTIGGVLDDDNETITSTESDAPTIKRDIFGGGYGSDDFSTKTEITAGGFNEAKYTFTPMQLAGIVCGDTYVNIKRGHVEKNVYGGGELATVGLIDFNGAEQHKDIRNQGTATEIIYGFGLSWPYKMDFIPYMPDGTGPIGGTTNINVSGGRLGITGKDVLIDGGDKIDNGDIYGGSKGKAGDRYDMAFCGNVKATNITIDYPSSNGAMPENYKTVLTLPCVTGAVYGGGEDGHVIEDTHVTLKNGLVGHAIYGGGSGKGKYTQKLYKIGSTTEKHDVDIFSVTAGKVYGNTHVKMEGGYVVRFVYGGGNMGSVGKGNYSSGTDDYYPAGYGETLEHDKLWQSTFDPEQAISNTNKPDTAYYFLSSGKTEVEIIGGEIGYVDTADPTESMKDGLPYGSVFGGSRGESAPNIGESPRYWYSPQFFSGYVNETKVTIGGYRCKEGNSTYKKGDCLTAAEFNAAFPSGNSNWELVSPIIKGSVFGGGQDGHVRRDTHVIVDAGEIGMAYNTENRKKVGTLSSTPTEEEINSLADLDNAQWLHRGNVYGAGSGIGKYEFDFNNDGTIDKSETTYTYINPQTGREVVGGVKEYDYSTSAGSVTRYTQVDINGGTIHRNVYGGGSLASVGPATIPPTRLEFAYKPGTTTRDSKYLKEGESDVAGPGWWSMNTVNVKGTVGTPTDYQAHYGGEVYGAGRGDLSIGEDFGVSVWTQVFIKNGARIMGNVFGGGDNGKVKRDTDVQIGEPATTP